MIKPTTIMAITTAIAIVVAAITGDLFALPVILLGGALGILFAPVAHRPAYGAIIYCCANSGLVIVRSGRGYRVTDYRAVNVYTMTRRGAFAELEQLSYQRRPDLLKPLTPSKRR